MQLSIVNPDPFTAPWSRSPRLQSIELVHRLVGSRDWTVAVNEDSSVVMFPFTVPNVRHLNSIFLSFFEGQSDSGSSSASWTVPNSFAEGEYEIAVRTTCTSSVSNPVSGWRLCSLGS